MFYRGGMELNEPQNQSGNIEGLSKYFSDKVLQENEVREAQANLLGFFNVLIEIDKQQRNDNDNRGSDPSN